MKKLILALGILLCFAAPAFAANTCTYTGAGTALASDASNWAGCGGVAPTTTDIVIFNGVFAGTGNDNCTWDITAAIGSINTTGYTGLVTASVTMTVTSGVTFANSTFAHGNQLFKFTGNQTVNTGTAGNAFYDLTADASNIAVTLASNITADRNVNLQAATANSYWATDGTARTFFIKGNLTTTSPYVNVATNFITIEFTGTASQSMGGYFGSTSSAYWDAWKFNFRVNKASGTLTMVFAETSGIFYHGGSGTSFTWVSGTVDWSTNSVKYFWIGDKTLATGSGMHFYNFQSYASSILTMSDHIYVDHTFSAYTDSQPTYNGAYKVYALGDVDASTQYRFLGTFTLEFSGSASQSFTSIAGSAGGAYAGGMEINVTINKSGGTLTWSGGNTFRFGGSKTLTYTAGTVDTGTSVLAFSGGYTINVNGITWYDVSFTGGGTFVLTSNMALSRNLILINSVTTNTFSGSGSIRKITVGGDVTATSGRAVGTSSTDYIDVELNGTGSQTYTGNTSYVNVPGRLRFNKASGTAVMAGGLIPYAGITHVLGANDFTTNSVATLIKDNANAQTITSNGGITFYSFGLSNDKAVTLADNMTVSNNLDIGAGAVGTSTFNGYKVILHGDFLNTAGNQVTGSTGVEFAGSGSQTWSQANTTYVILATGTLNINKPSGTLTLSGNLRFDGTIQRTLGTVSAGTSVLYVKAAQTINTGSGMSWYDINMAANITLGSDLQFSHDFTRTAGAVSGAYYLKPTGSTTHLIDGTMTVSGFDCASGETCSFDDADIFTITNGKGDGTWQSDHATNTVDIDFTTETINGNGTRVDSAGGVIVRTSGTITDCVNWAPPPPPYVPNFLAVF